MRGPLAALTASGLAFSGGPPHCIEVNGALWQEGPQCRLHRYQTEEIPSALTTLVAIDQVTPIR